MCRSRGLENRLEAAGGDVFRLLDPGPDETLVEDPWIIQTRWRGALQRASYRRVPLPHGRISTPIPTRYSDGSNDR